MKLEDREKWFENPRWMRAPKHVLSAAVTVVDDSNRLLLIKSPTRGWEIPGGQVEASEEITRAAIREVHEESGIEVRISAFCGVFQTVSRSVCNFLFLGEPVGGVPTTSSESLEVGWFDLPQALDMITHENFRSRVEHCLNSTSHPFLVEYELPE